MSAEPIPGALSEDEARRVDEIVARQWPQLAAGGAEPATAPRESSGHGSWHQGHGEPSVGDEGETVDAILRRYGHIR